MGPIPDALACKGQRRWRPILGGWAEATTAAHRMFHRFLWMGGRYASGGRSASEPREERLELRGLRPERDGHVSEIQLIFNIFAPAFSALFSGRECTWWCGRSLISSQFRSSRTEGDETMPWM